MIYLFTVSNLAKFVSNLKCANFKLFRLYTCISHRNRKRCNERWVNERHSMVIRCVESNRGLEFKPRLTACRPHGRSVGNRNTPDVVVSYTNSGTQSIDTASATVSIDILCLHRYSHKQRIMPCESYAQSHAQFYFVLTQWWAVFYNSVCKYFN
jgi:hypothetical protein